MNLFSLKDKVIVITGASGLLGREHVEAVCLAGGIPVLIDLNKEIIDNQVKKVNLKYGIQTRGYVVDITDENSVKENSSQILNDFGSISGLVNNAANNPKIEISNNKNFSRLEYFSKEIWNNDLEVGLTGAFLCLKYYGYNISKNTAGGSIVNISSDLGLIAPDQRLYQIDGLTDDKQPVKPVSYSAVKSALIGITRYVSTYWADKNVRCNAICPGGVENNQNNLFLEKIKKRIPMGRMAFKNEYQGLLIFLLSNASSYVNGAIIAADGGRSVW